MPLPPSLPDAPVYSFNILLSSYSSIYMYIYPVVFIDHPNIHPTISHLSYSYMNPSNYPLYSSNHHPTLIYIHMFIRTVYFYSVILHSSSILPSYSSNFHPQSFISIQSTSIHVNSVNVFTSNFVIQKPGSKILT